MLACARSLLMTRADLAISAPNNRRLHLDVAFVVPAARSSSAFATFVGLL